MHSNRSSKSQRVLESHRARRRLAFNGLIALCLSLAAILLWWMFSQPTETPAVATSVIPKDVQVPATVQEAQLIRPAPAIIAPLVPAKESLPTSLRGNHANLDGGLYEDQLLGVVERVQQGDLNAALSEVNAHLVVFPKSLVGQRLRAQIQGTVNGDSPTVDMVATLPQSMPDAAPIATPSARGELDLDGLRQQLQLRWLHTRSEFGQQTHSRVPSALLHLGNHKHVLVADMERARLYVYRNVEGRAELVSDYYLTVGSQGYGKRLEGDNKTPIGVYRVTRWIHPDTLPDLYGSGAFPVDYPNYLDKAKRRTGYGIWLHGTPSNTYARAPWASEGCFVLSNDDFEHIQQFIDVGEQTPVVLAERVNWVQPQALNATQAELRASIEAWRKAWESLDMAKYLDFYAEDGLHIGSGGFAQWAERKKQANRTKTFVQVQVELEGLFEYPGETEMVVAYFKQAYLSNNHADMSDKVQYWQRTANGRWQIVFEN